MQIPFASDLILLIIPLLAVVFTWLFHSRVQAGKIPRFRPLPGIASLEARLSELVEAGRPVHVATGASQPGTVGATAETLASLLITQRLAQASTRQGGGIAVTNGDVVTNAAARGIVRQAYHQTSFAADYGGYEAQLAAHQTPVAYAAGVARRYAVEPMDASLVVGDYGSEALLIAEEGAQRGVPQLSGATTLSALPALTLSTDATLVGEELFAAVAYLSSAPAPKARLLTQDALRWIVILLLIGGIAYVSLNALFALGLPSF